MRAIKSLFQHLQMSIKATAQHLKVNHVTYSEPIVLLMSSVTLRIDTLKKRKKKRGEMTNIFFKMEEGLGAPQVPFSLLSEYSQIA